MKISADEARRIAALAHLEFDDDGLVRMAAEMTTILGYIETLPDVATTEHDASQTPLREDKMQPSLDRDLVARNAPEWDRGFFVVPAVIEGES